MRHIIMIFLCKNICQIWNTIKRSNFLNHKLRNQNALEFVYFEHSVDIPTVFALSCLSFTIYSEWLDRKNNSVSRSETEIISFIRNRLTHRLWIYKFSKWNSIAYKLNELISLI